ncbi:MAG: signal peptide peptidase SppA [Candidatus Anstonellales archaeon]
MDSKKVKVAAGIIIGLAIFSVIAIAGIVYLLHLPIGGKCVAVIKIDQEITTEGEKGIFGPLSLGSDEIAAVIKDVDERDDVGAVLFVVNSPGGSVVGSREIYLAVEQMKKPKVVYMREVAGSGAYYISAPADYIYADPNTLTGSIGVVATFTDLSRLFEMLGINMTSITSGDMKDIGSPSRPMTEKERAIVQGIVDEVFQDFKGVVLKHRGNKLNMEKFNEVLDGRILTGRQAKAIGLIDDTGTMEDAIKKAMELGGIEERNICEIDMAEQSMLGSLYNEIMRPSAKKRVTLNYE